jgi:hypothetical protein
MTKRNSVHGRCLAALFFFTWSCLVAGFLHGEGEDPLVVAQGLIRVGSYDEAARVLDAYIEKIRDIPKQKGKAAEAHYLLAKMYFEVGADTKCEDNLKAALALEPELGKDEPRADFRERLDRVRSEVAPRIYEKLKKDEQRRLHHKKKFPWLLVVGAAVAVVIAVLLLAKKKKATYTLTVTVGEGVTGTFASGSVVYPRGTVVPYQFAASPTYKNLTVKINGTVSAASGTLTMDRDIQLEATATLMSAAVTLIVDGMSNSIWLFNSCAVDFELPVGKYTLQQVSGNAYWASAAAFKYVLVHYFDDNEGKYHVTALSISQPPNLVIGEAHYKSTVFAFFIDHTDLADNSGEVTLHFGSIQIKVHGKNNCIPLGGIPPAKVEIPAGTYQVRVSGSVSAPGHLPLNEVLVFFNDSSGSGICQALPIGQIGTLSSGGGKFYAFFADANSQLSGQVKLEFLN